MPPQCWTCRPAHTGSADAAVPSSRAAPDSHASPRRAADIVARAHRFAVPDAGVQNQHPGGPSLENSGSRTEIQDRRCQGLRASAASHRPIVDAEAAIWQRAASSRASSGQHHLASGTPDSAGSAHASATASARSVAVNTGGRSSCLRHVGSAHQWQFAIHRASHNDYDESVFPAGLPIGTCQQALATACGEDALVRAARLSQRGVAQSALCNRFVGDVPLRQRAAVDAPLVLTSRNPGPARRGVFPRFLPPEHGAVQHAV